MTVANVTEITSSSPKGCGDAIARGKVTTCRVRMHVTFVLED